MPHNDRARLTDLEKSIGSHSEKSIGLHFEKLIDSNFEKTNGLHSRNKLASLKLSVTDPLTGVKSRASSVAKKSEADWNFRIAFIW